MDKRRKIGSESEARPCLAAVSAAGVSLMEWARERVMDGRSLHAWRMSLERAPRVTVGSRRSSAKITMVRVALVVSVCAVGLAPAPVSAQNDADGDGIEDGADLCPAAAETLDGIADADGCPDADGDSDGVPDDWDLCPAEAETVNGFEDEDGCADAAAAELHTLSQRVFFATSSHALDARARRTITQLVGVLRANPDLTRVRVEGFADARGVAEDNLALSQRRAAAARDAVVAQGIAADRLRAVGRGALAGESPAIEQQNRRASFVVEQVARRAPLAPIDRWFLGEWSGTGLVDVTVRADETYANVRPGAPSWLGPAGSRVGCYAWKIVGEQLVLHCRGVDVAFTLLATRAGTAGRGLIVGAGRDSPRVASWGSVFTCPADRTLVEGRCRTEAERAAARSAGTGAPSVPAGGGLIGTWSGTVRQTGFGDYPMNLTITAVGDSGPCGSVEYPTLSCGGEIVCRPPVDGQQVLLERITYGTNCIDGGTMRVRPHGATGLIWHWYYPDGRHGAMGRLGRR